MSKKVVKKADADAAKASRHGPGRKRMGDEPFVPVTMKVEPADLATINTIAKYSGRSRSDVMREMLSYGLAHAMRTAFGNGPVDPQGEDAGPDADDS